MTPCEGPGARSPWWGLGQSPKVLERCFKSALTESEGKYGAALTKAIPGKRVRWPTQLVSGTRTAPPEKPAARIRRVRKAELS